MGRLPWSRKSDGKDRPRSASRTVLRWLGILALLALAAGLTVGLALSVVVILILLTGFFQSFRLGLISIGAVPGVVCGVAVILYATGTTLNIESFMGSIMCIGV